MLHFDWKVATTVYVVLQLQWIIGALGAVHDGMLTVGQMRKYHADQGIPYLQHYGMWNDVVFIHPLCAVLAGLFAAGWVSNFPNPAWMVAIVLLCFSLSYRMNEIWVRGPTVQAQGWDSTLLLAGWVHVFQMTVIVFIFAMSTVSFMVLWSMDMLPLNFLLGCLCLLLAHVCIGWHWPLRYENYEWSPFHTSERDMAPAIVAALYVGLNLAAAVLFLYEFFNRII